MLLYMKVRVIILQDNGMNACVSTMLGFKANQNRSVQFSPDSEQLISCSDDKSIKIWSSHRTKFQFGLAGHMNWVRCAKFSPDARYISLTSNI